MKNAYTILSLSISVTVAIFLYFTGEFHEIMEINSFNLLILLFISISGFIVILINKPLRTNKKVKGMELEEFVSNTLKEIIAGVKDAQEYAKENGACINPNEFGTLTKPEHIINLGDGNVSIVQPVSFDVCIVSKKTKSGKGGIEIVSGGMESMKGTESRVKFSVAVSFPPMKPNYLGKEADKI